MDDRVKNLEREIADLRVRVARFEEFERTLCSRMAALEVRHSSMRLRARDGAPDQRGKSPIAQLLSGATMRAKKNGIPHGHDRLVRMLAPGTAMLGYSFGLAAVAACFPREQWTAMGAYQIGECWRLNIEPKERAEREARWSREGRQTDGGN